MSASIVLDANQVTLKLVNGDTMSVGDTVSYGGNTYTMVDNNSDLTSLTHLIAKDKAALEHIRNTDSQLLANTVTTMVTNMDSLFRRARVEYDIGSWDVSNVTNMHEMFQEIKHLSSDIGSWDVSNVENMDSMFERANGMKNIDLKRWNVSQFNGEPDRFDRSIGSGLIPPEWGTSGNTSQIIVIIDTNDIVKLLNAESFNVGNTISINRIQYTVINSESDLTGLTHLIPVNKAALEHIRDTDESLLPNVITSMVDTMDELFKDNTSFDLDISKWDVSNVKSMRGMFQGASSFNQDISFWEVHNVSTMDSMFQDASSFNQAIQQWKVKQIPSEPSNFSSNAPLTNENTPVWGTGEAPTASIVLDPNGKTLKLQDSYLLSVGESISYDGNTYTLVDSDSDLTELTHLIAKDKATLVKIKNRDATLLPNTITTLVTDMSVLFQQYSINVDITSWDVSNVANMNAMFRFNSNFNQPIGHWDVSNVVNMESMFRGATHFNQPIGTWDVSNVVNVVNSELMFYMFGESTQFNQDLKGWNVSRIFSEPRFFAVSIAGQKSPLTEENKPLWGTIGNARKIIQYANGVTLHLVNGHLMNVGDIVSYNGNDYTLVDSDSDLTELTHLIAKDKATLEVIRDTDKALLQHTITTLVTDMSNLFENQANFDVDISSWDVFNVSDMSYMFSGASTFNQLIGVWDVSNVSNMTGMFKDSLAFNQDLTGWNVIQILSEPSDFAVSDFIVSNRPIWGTYGVTPKIVLDKNGVTQKLVNYDTLNVADQVSYNGNTYTMVDSNSDLTRLTYTIAKDKDALLHIRKKYKVMLQYTITTLVTDMEQLFNNQQFNFPIGHWDVSNVTTTQLMFRGSDFNQPIGHWDVSNVTNMSRMFMFSSSFNQPIGNWDVSNVVNMEYMFQYATAFNQPIGNWNVSKVQGMDGMFQEATAFNQPIGNWDVSNVLSMTTMFQEATAFNQPIGNWDVSKVQDMRSMFEKATTFNQPIGNWDVSNVAGMTSMFKDTVLFNQSLQSWNVSHISWQPMNFTIGSSLEDKKKPIWGTTGIPASVAGLTIPEYDTNIAVPETLSASKGFVVLNTSVFGSPLKTKEGFNTDADKRARLRKAVEVLRQKVVAKGITLGSTNRIRVPRTSLPFADVFQRNFFQVADNNATVNLADIGSDGIYAALETENSFLRVNTPNSFIVITNTGNGNFSLQLGETTTTVQEGETGVHDGFRYYVGSGSGEPASTPICFLKGVLIPMADGSHKAVEEIQKGDQVKTEWGSGEVVATRYWKFPLNEETQPVQIGDNLVLSKTHKVRKGGKFMNAEAVGTPFKVDSEFVEYYHFQTRDWKTDFVPFSDSVSAEVWDGLEWNAPVTLQSEVLWMKLKNSPEMYKYARVE